MQYGHSADILGIELGKCDLEPVWFGLKLHSGGHLLVSFLACQPLVLCSFSFGSLELCTTVLPLEHSCPILSQLFIQILVLQGTVF